MNKQQRRRRWMLIGGLCGLLVGGTLGFLFGRFAYPTMDIAKALGNADPDAFALLFAWLLGILAAIGGAQWGRTYASKQEKRNKQLARRRKYADVLEAYEQEKAREETSPEHRRSS